MGCGNVKQSVESSLDDISTNPTTGLPSLLTVLNYSAKDPSHQENIKRNVPRIFELLPKAMESLNEKNSKAVFAACAVIEHCVEVHNGVVAEDTPPKIDVEYLKQCQSNLVALLRKAQEKAARTFLEEDRENDTSSKEAKAIALATVALFKLEKYATECKQEFKRSGGVQVALNAMETETSGIKREAMQALAWLLSLFVEKPWGENVNNIEAIIESGGSFLLISYTEGASKYDVPRDMQAYCRTVLEAILQYGKVVNNRDDIKRAIAASASRRPSMSS